MPKRIDIPYMSLQEAKQVYNNIKKKLGCITYIAGSVRRKQERVSDIDIIITNLTENLKEKIKNIFYKIERFGEKIITGIYMHNNHKVLVDIFIVSKQELPYAMLQYTGPKAYNIRIRKYVKDRGYLLNQYGLFYSDNKEMVTNNIKTEKDLIKFIGTTYYKPEDRH
jgi:DNA polymerase (family 10)